MLAFRNGCGGLFPIDLNVILTWKTNMPSRSPLVQPVLTTPEEMGPEFAGIVPQGDPNKRPTISSIESAVRSLSASGQPFIPVCQPDLGGNEKKYVLECLEQNWISSAGRFINEFERAFADYCGVPHAVACSSGTSALHLAIAALDLGPGDEVILPAFTMIATINAVAYCGATPVLVDAEPRTWNLDLNQLEAKITPRTKLAIPVHTYGHPVDMDRIMTLADRYGFWVLEDAAEAHGALYKGRRTGSLGHLAAFSFYANKMITTGEGGMITTTDPEIARVIRTLRDHAFTPQRHFWHMYRGYNYRMTNLQAAIGLAQVEQIAEFVKARRRNAYLYSELLREVPGIATPPEADTVESCFWMYGVLVDPAFGLTRDELRRRLAGAGIETRTFFIPMHLQPIYFRQFRGQRFPVAEDLCRRGFYYPSSSTLTETQIRFIVDATKDACTMSLEVDNPLGTAQPFGRM